MTIGAIVGCSGLSTTRSHPPRQRALALERPQVVERRSRRHLEPVADLPDGGRHAVLRDERAHEAEDLLLLVGQLAHDTSLAGYDTQRVLRKASKKRGWSTQAPRARRPDRC